MNPSTIEVVATALFALAVIHTFLVKKFEHIAHTYPEGSIGENFFHFMGEVEAVFGMWAGVFVLVFSFFEGFAVYDEHHHAIGGALHFIESLNYTEPVFVFVIMCMAGTRPVILMAEKLIVLFAKVMPFSQKRSFYMSALILGPLLGSFITEPAAMTVTALILLDKFYSKDMSDKFKYATLGLLFVNVSIGGTLSHFAAPPVLMVAAKWHWGFAHMIGNFGYKAAIAVVVGTILISQRFASELQGELDMSQKQDGKLKPTWWINLTHIIFMGLVVMTAHHMQFFLPLFLFFLGFATVTQEYQEEIKLKESLLVGFFLGGLVTLGNLQAWWLKPVLSGMPDLALFLGSTGLTGITDNAALTYLGSLVELSESAKYFLVAGAVTGGGLTVIANAPNPAGFSILKDAFGKEGISPLGLLKSALIPTVLALIAFYFLPGIGGGGH
jgi:hypothetical protein